MKSKLKPKFKININKRQIAGSIFCIVFGLSIGLGYGEYFETGTSWHSVETKSQSLSVCFTPPSGCGSLIAKNISEAEETIFMQSYSLSNKAIINQLITASKRGVKVRAILDSSNFSEGKTVVEDLRKSGIEVVKDPISGIAHNKIIIIDESKVITGSFNFSEAVDKRNAENVVLIQDKNIASQYLGNWHKRY